MKVALVYDRVNKWGGAERVLLALHEIFPKAPLYTSVYSLKDAFWARVFSKVFTSFLQRYGFLRKRHEYLGTLMPIAFESFNFDQYDLVISVTSEAALGIITKPKTKHLCYCLTPTRYLWSGYDFYFNNPFLRFLAFPAIKYLRAWGKIAAKRPDTILAISREVKSRIKRFYGREADIVYPPVDVNQFRKSSNIQRQDLFLVVARLVGYKRVDLAVEAFNELGRPLVIVGSGSEEKKLKKISRNNIKFVGSLTDNGLADYYKKCAGVIFPQEEDFGIVAVEAQSAGAPVIAYRKGGALDIVIENKTGIFFDRQTKECLKEAINKFDRMKFNEKEIIKSADRFSEDRFKEKILSLTKK